MKAIASILVLAGATVGAVTVAAPIPAYRVVGSIPGPDGGWDYVQVDPATHRLYIARHGSITVVDTDAQRATASIGTLAHGHAVLLISGKRLLATSGDDDSVRFLRTADGSEVVKIGVGRKPDAAILSRNGRTAFVINAEGGTVSVIDVVSMKIDRTISVKPGLEYAALADDGTLFVNDEDANEIEVVNVAVGKVSGVIALPGCEAPSGLALDRKSGRLIAACANGKAAIADAKTRRLIRLVDIGLGPDAVILDTKRNLAFVPCGKDGVLDVLALDGPVVNRVARVVTEKGARTGAIDAATGTIYLPTARVGPSSATGERPSVLPGSFHVLVVRPIGSGGS